MTSTSTGGWRRRTLYQPESGPDAPMQLAMPAVMAHGCQLYNVYQVRWDSGRQIIAAHMSNTTWGCERSEDTLLDLMTGEEVTITHNEADVSARCLSINEFPPALLEVWPRDDACRPISPGYRANGVFVGSADLHRIAQLGLDLQPSQPSLFE